MELVVQNLSVTLERWPLKEPFTISRHTFVESLVATATLRDDGGLTGRGEGEPHEWDFDAAHALLDSARVGAPTDRAPPWLDGLTRDNIGSRLPRTPLRNAIDCALWDLEAKREGVPAHTLAGLPWQPLDVLSTIGIAAPDAMARTAASLADAHWLKVKLGGKDGRDAERLEAVTAAAPGVPILLDPNGGWDLSTLTSMLPLAARLGVRIIEQPMLPRDDALMPKPPGDLVFCADESCLDRQSLDAVAGRFQCINIKLDKAGGLTEALALRREAERRGLRVMVGMNSGTSLAVAPAFLLAQGLEVVDLEVGFLTRDRDAPIVVDDYRMQPPSPDLWG